MESTGQRGKIQASPNTAKLLQETGKAHWLKPRIDKVEAKGKGSMVRFFYMFLAVFDSSMLED
jgi:hypothetical protein